MLMSSEKGTTKLLVTTIPTVHVATDWISRVADLIIAGDAVGAAHELYRGVHGGAEPPKGEVA